MIIFSWLLKYILCYQSSSFNQVKLFVLETIHALKSLLWNLNTIILCFYLTFNHKFVLYNVHGTFSITFIWKTYHNYLINYDVTKNIAILRLNNNHPIELKNKKHNINNWVTV